MATPSDVTRNDARTRYELHVDGQLAVSEYNQPAGERGHVTHTEVPEALAERATMCAQGLQVIPLRPFVTAFIRRQLYFWAKVRVSAKPYPP